MAAAEPWLTVGQAHQRLAELGISEQTVRDWADAQRLKSRRLGGGDTGHRRIDPKAVEAELRRFRGEDLQSPDTP